MTDREGRTASTTRSGPLKPSTTLTTPSGATSQRPGPLAPNMKPRYPSTWPRRASPGDLQTSSFECAAANWPLLTPDTPEAFGTPVRTDFDAFCAEVFAHFPTRTAVAGGSGVRGRRKAAEAVRPMPEHVPHENRRDSRSPWAFAEYTGELATGTGSQRAIPGAHRSQSAVRADIRPAHSRTRGTGRAAGEAVGSAPTRQNL